MRSELEPHPRPWPTLGYELVMLVGVFVGPRDTRTPTDVVPLQRANGMPLLASPAIVRAAI